MPQRRPLWRPWRRQAALDRGTTPITATGVVWGLWAELRALKAAPRGTDTPKRGSAHIAAPRHGSWSSRGALEHRATLARHNRLPRSTLGSRKKSTAHLCLLTARSARHERVLAVAARRAPPRRAQGAVVTAAARGARGGSGARRTGRARAAGRARGGHRVARSVQYLSR